MAMYDSEGNFYAGYGDDQDTNARYLSIWNGDGTTDQKLEKIAADGAGYSGAVEWANKNGFDVSNTGIGRVVQQQIADASEKGTDHLREGIKATTLGGAAVLGGLAAAPYLGAGTAAGAAMPAAVPESAAALAEMGLVETAPGVWAAGGAGAGAAAGASGGAAALPDAGVDMGVFGEHANPYVTGTASLPSGSLAAAGLGAGAVGGGGVLSGLASGAGAGAAGAAAGSATSGAMSNSSGSIMGDDEWLKILGRGIPGILGAVGASSQAEDLEDLSHQYMQMGDPYRTKLAQLYGDPSAFLNSPEVQQPIQQGTNMLARSLSTKGNPAGSGNALQELQNYASTQLFSKLGEEKNRLANFGGLSRFAEAAPGAATNSIKAQGDVYSNLGGAAADIFNPAKRFSLQDLMRAY